MKLLNGMIFAVAITASGPSPASLNPSLLPHYGSYAVQDALYVIKNDPAPVLTVRTRPNNTSRLLLKRSQKRLLTQTQPKNILLEADDNDEPPGSDEVDLQVSYRRPELTKPVDDDADLSDRIKIRLWLARQLALEKYGETWG